MSYQLITSAATGINNNQAVIKNAGFAQTYQFDGSSLVPTGVSRFENYIYGSFSMGSGINIGTNGTVLYDAETVGSGLLDNVLLINLSYNTLYFGLNQSTISVSNGIPLGSGESYQVETPDVRRIWAVTQSAGAVIGGGGNYKINRNTN